MEKTESVSHEGLMELTAEVVSAYVSNNPLPPGELIKLIGDVHSALRTVGNFDGLQNTEPLTPAVPVKKSIGEDFIICLEDGKKFKSLKRHLRTHYDITPEQYREKWSLPADYPMVAPSYTRERSELAKKMGLGQRRKAR